MGKLGQRHLKTGTIKAYITSVYSAQLDMGVTQAELEVFYHLALKKIVTRINKLQDKTGRKKRYPIIRPILLRLLV